MMKEVDSNNLQGGNLIVPSSSKQYAVVPKAIAVGRAMQSTLRAFVTAGRATKVQTAQSAARAMVQ